MNEQVLNEQAAPAVYKRIVEAQHLMMQEGIGKTKRNTGGGNFLYRGIDDVYQALAPVLVKTHLNIRAIRIDKEEDVTAGKMRMVRIKVVYRVTCFDDASSFDVESLGEGSDISDKAAGKAMSYAFKQMIFQLLCIPVVGIEDPDAETIEPTAPMISESLRNAAMDAACDGVKAFRAWFMAQRKEDRAMINLDAAFIAECQKAAQQADSMA